MGIVVDSPWFEGDGSWVMHQTASLAREGMPCLAGLLLPILRGLPVLVFQKPGGFPSSGSPDSSWVNLGGDAAASQVF